MCKIIFTIYVSPLHPGTNLLWRNLLAWVTHPNFLLTFSLDTLWPSCVILGDASQFFSFYSLDTICRVYSDVEIFLLAIKFSLPSPQPIVFRFTFPYVSHSYSFLYVLFHLIRCLFWSFSLSGFPPPILLSSLWSHIHFRFLDYSSPSSISSAPLPFC